jgi:hypothetical protein
LPPSLAIAHESAHKELALTPFSLFIKHEIFELYRLILTTFEEEQEQINVPVTIDVAGNAIQKQLEFIYRLAGRTKLVEEVYAVRSSLLHAQERGLISHGYMHDLIKINKEKYGEIIPEFSIAYDAFDLVARKIGKTAAMCLIHHLFETGYPETAFAVYILEMCEIEKRDSLTTVRWALPDEASEFILNLSYEEAYRFFIKCTSAFDRGELRHKNKREGLLEVVELIRKEWSSRVQDSEDNFIKFIYSSPTAVLYSEYSDNIHHFPKIRCDSESLYEVDYGNFLIILEAIRQQLITGIGLLCPFWNSSHGCCSSENRALLEKVWSCTKPDSSCDWERLGCLAKGALSRDQRKRSKTSDAKA